MEVEVHWYLEDGKSIEAFCVVVEVPLLVGHMVVAEIVVIEVLFALFVTHVVVVATIVVGRKFVVPIVVDIPIVSLVALVTLEKLLVVVGIAIGMFHKCQVDLDFFLY